MHSTLEEENVNCISIIQGPYHKVLTLNYVVEPSVLIIGHNEFQSLRPRWGQCHRSEIHSLTRNICRQ